MEPDTAFYLVYIGVMFVVDGMLWDWMDRHADTPVPALILGAIWPITGLVALGMWLAFKAKETP